MKYAKKLIVFYIFYLVAGALLVAAAVLWSPAGQREDIVTGIVSGFLFTGIGGLIIAAYLLKHPARAEKVEIAKTEERSQFLRLRIKSAVNSVMLMLVCAGTFAAMISGYREISLTLAALLITEVILYIGFGAYYAKKY